MYAIQTMHKSQRFTSVYLNIFASQQGPKSQKSSVTFSTALRASIIATLIQLILLFTESVSVNKGSVQ